MPWHIFIKIEILININKDNLLYLYQTLTNDIDIWIEKN